MHSDSAVRLVASEYVPAKQTWAADAPSGQKLPAMQGLHVTAPSRSWKVPPLHLLHSLAPVSLLNVPGAHFVSASDPVGQNVPSEHIMQSSLLSITFDKLA